MLIKAVRRASSRGLVGPSYRGISGKLRNIWQSLVWRDEIVSIFVAGMRLPSEPAGPALDIVIVERFEQLDAFRDQLDQAYHPGFSDTWEQPFQWGETLILGVSEGKVAGFRWLQTGDHRGPLCHYTRLLPGEFRIVRGGVLPAWRGRGVHAKLHWLLLSSLIARGASRVYIDCSSDNVVSHKAQCRAGYRPFLIIRSLGSLWPKTLVLFKVSILIDDAALRE
jgi:hypothetical protein